MVAMIFRNSFLYVLQLTVLSSELRAVELDASWGGADFNMPLERDVCDYGCKCYDWEMQMDTHSEDEAQVEKKRFKVECEHSNLNWFFRYNVDYSGILQRIPYNTTDLVISGMSNLEIGKVEARPFSLWNPRLLTFTVDRCSFVVILPNAFKSPVFDAVRSIQISNNLMESTELKENTVSILPSLEAISVTRNTFLKTVQTGAVRVLPLVKVVNLSRNSINEIQPGAFDNLPSLTTLDLSYNFLRTIPGEDIISLSGSSLQSLDLGGNWWNCSCEMSWILLLPRSIFANSNQAVCWDPPSLNGTALHDLTPEHFQHCCPVDTYFYVCMDFLFFLLSLLSTVAGICMPTLLQAYKYYVSKTLVKCGQVEFNIKDILGPNVFKGKLKDGNSVAIKRVPQKLTQQPRELEILLHVLNSPPHPNVIRYFLKEDDSDTLYTYIALELCEGNLRDLLRDAISREYMGFSSIECLLQITKGLRHLHNCRVEHRDIKPANVLWKVDNTGEYRFIVADFDLGHMTEEMSSHKPEYGTKGWSAPELWKQGERTTAVDIFSLGCVFFYVLTRGWHPFDSSRSTATGQLPHMDAEAVQGNIENYQISLEGLGEHCDEVTAETAKDLIGSMIQNDPHRRPKAKEVLEHPLFWDAKQQKDFFLKIGRFLGRKQTFTELVDKLEQCRSDVFQDNWMDRLDEAVKKSVEGIKQYKTELCALVREVRNKIEHFEKLKPKLQGIFNNSPEGVVHYFNSQFPKLLTCTYKAYKEAGVRSDSTT